MFALATRKKLRFATAKGEISVEDLWDLPRHNINEKGSIQNPMSLKSIARKIQAQLKDMDVVDEFDDKDELENEEITILKLKLDIVRYILKVKLEEFENKKNQSQIKEDNQRILEIIERKKAQELENLSVEELMKKIK